MSPTLRKMSNLDLWDAAKGHRRTDGKAYRRSRVGEKQSAGKRGRVGRRRTIFKRLATEREKKGRWYRARRTAGG